MKNSRLLRGRNISRPSRIQNILHIISLLIAITVLCAKAHAQLVNDSATVTIGPGSTNITGNLVIGTNGSFTSLIITNSGAVTNSGSGTIGLNSGSRSNRVTVSGASSVWHNATTLNIGSAGAFNLLVITNGGKVINTFGNISQNSGSSNNAVIVTGVGSLWTNSGAVNMGNGGSSNRVIVSNGGLVVSGNAAIGFNFTSKTNEVVITDAGSLWKTVDAFVVGPDANSNFLTVSNGGKLISGGAFAGAKVTPAGSGNGNRILITGANSTWTNSAGFGVGDFGSSNQFTISGGAVVRNTSISVSSYVGGPSSGSNNVLLVTGTNSTFSSGDNTSITSTRLSVGNGGSGNQLLVRDGALVEVGTGAVGDNGTQNVAVVADGGSTWRNFKTLFVGASGSSSQLFITNNGTVTTTNLVVGNTASSTNNSIIMTSGNLFVTNASSGGAFDLRRGVVTLNSGLLVADTLLMTNGNSSEFNFFGGTLRVRNTTVSSGAIFNVGGFGGRPTLELIGSGTHNFADGLTLSSDATLAGSGSVIGNISMAGTLLPGNANAIGRLNITGGITFATTSTNVFELNQSLGTNDNLAGLTSVAYGGALVVTNLAGTLIAGDTFKLFDSAIYSGSFSSITLPPLNSGLFWKNTLATNGSIQVIADPMRSFGVDVSHFQNETGIPQSSWDQMYVDGKRFAFIKATEGLTGPHDATMSNNVGRATAAGLLAGVYHYAHPENRPTTNGAILEASNMVLYAGSAIGPGKLRPVLDIEGSAGNLTTAALTDWVIAFSNEIIARRGQGAAPIIYCTESFANNKFDSRVADYDLWIRAVSTGLNPSIDDPPAQGFTNAIGVFNNWAFWQYSASGSSGGISPLDLNVCHNEYKTLNSFLIPVPQAVAFAVTGVTVVSNGTFQLNFTNTPGASFSILATTNIGLPLNSWIVLGNASEISPGQFQFADSQATNFPQRFYQVRWP
ncbi:MAG: GH25 family lysozyme [Verrucomicrobiota bacterium]